MDFVQYQDLPGIYAQAHLLVFPTLADEWGVVVNEAMAAGLPVLGSVFSQAVEELIVDQVTGWIYNPEQVTEAEKVIDQALRTPVDQLKRMGLAGRQRIQDFNVCYAVNQILRSFETIDGQRVAMDQDENPSRS